jgi:hypothetical protein
LNVAADALQDLAPIQAPEVNENGIRGFRGALSAFDAIFHPVAGAFD